MEIDRELIDKVIKPFVVEQKYKSCPGDVYLSSAAMTRQKYIDYFTKMEYEEANNGPLDGEDSCWGLRTSNYDKREKADSR